jgi:hypothetical protein
MNWFVPLFALALATSSLGEIVADFPSAREKAQTAQTGIAVLIHGSDWNAQSEAMADIFSDPRFAQSIGSGSVLLLIDRKESPTPQDLQLDETNKDCQPPVRSLPAIAYYDSEGRLIGCISGPAEIQAAGGPVITVKKFQTMLAERDAVWKRAAGTNGYRKAELLGAGLDRMNFGLGPKNLYQPILDDMKKADPTDRSGYIGKYTFNHRNLLGMVQTKAKEKDFAPAVAELAMWNRNARLNNLQRQQLHAVRFALYQSWPEKKSLIRPALEDMRKVDPKSYLGIAAANYLSQLKEEG